MEILIIAGIFRTYILNIIHLFKAVIFRYHPDKLKEIVMEYFLTVRFEIVYISNEADAKN